MTPDEVKAFTAKAEQGDAKAQRSLGLAYLFGDGVAEDQSAGARWLTLAANQDDPTAEYYLGQCYQNGFGVVKDIDVGFRWQFRATLHGYAVPSNYTPAEQEALKEWSKVRIESLAFLKNGQLAKAYLTEKDCFGIATEKLREKRWPTIASSLRLLEIATKQKRWPIAYQHYITAQHGAINAIGEAILKPSEIEIPEYMSKSAQLMLKRKVKENDSNEGVRLLSEQIRILQSEFGQGNIFIAPTLRERARAYFDLKQMKAADSDYEEYLRLNREYLGQDVDIMVMALMDYADYLGQRQRLSEKASIIEEAFVLNQKNGKIDYGYTWIKGSLLKAQVARRLQDAEEFMHADKLPSSEDELRRLADKGDPLACFRLSVGLSSGEFRSRVTVDMVELSPESKLYMDASVIPFIDDTKLTDGYFNELVARRFARLGHGFAQQALSKYLTNKHEPWPKLSGLAASSRDTELTKESYALLCKAAEAGVPEAIHELSSALWYGRYAETNPKGKYDEYEPFVGSDGHWYKRVYIPETKGKQTVQRINDEPVVIEKDLAKAAHYLRKEFIFSLKADAAWRLAFIYMDGARGSSRLSYGERSYPPILPDKIESAAYFYVCLYAPGPGFMWANETSLKEILSELNLSTSQHEEAQQRARALIASRVRG